VSVERFGSGGPWEESVGYSRAVRAGPFVFVAGTTAVTEDGAVLGGGDPYEQARACWAAVEAALVRAGAGLGDVVRTRMYVTDIAHFDEVGRAHRDAFAAVRPATAMVEVSGLADPRLLVEVEATAYVG